MANHEELSEYHLMAGRRRDDENIMGYLKNALRVWAAAGHTQAEFIERTGMAQSTVSQLFSGDRGMTVASFPQVFNAFKEKDLGQALTFLKAYLLDQVPAGLDAFVTIETHAETGAADPARGSAADRDQLEMAKDWLDRVYRSDPVVADFLVSAFKLSGGK